MFPYISSMVTLLFFFASTSISSAAPAQKLGGPPLSEQWFGIYVDNDRVGFYHQKISENTDGFRMEGDGSVRIKVMGFSKEVATREIYLVSKGLALRSFDVEQAINGVSSRVSGKVSGGSIRLMVPIDVRGLVVTIDVCARTVFAVRSVPIHRTAPMDF